MFELTDTTVKLASVNARAELHGEERKPAFDLKFTATMGSDVLIHFHPELRTTLFKRRDVPDLVEQVDAEALSALRFPGMGPLKWSWEGAGYELAVKYGISGVEDIVMDGVQIDGFSFLPIEGGSVTVNFRAICHPASRDVGRLCEFIQQEVTIDLMSPETLSQQGKLDVLTTECEVTE